MDAEKYEKKIFFFQDYSRLTIHENYFHSMKLLNNIKVNQLYFKSHAISVNYFSKLI